ncbi:hypothetical protein BIW11_04019 [Tropilaelaps mercedesae]|uniref:Uncharacterized protein n=1 Tax=Tropilaelaps mercedesae TaxID=418985 RepID=A0A1V9XCA3_9ACAR|nr:hypothetical protein BIW11_04019 [Tropilaelaps mercedesae]
MSFFTELSLTHLPLAALFSHDLRRIFTASRAPSELSRGVGLVPTAILFVFCFDASTPGSLGHAALSVGASTKRNPASNSDRTPVTSVRLFNFSRPRY